MNTEISCLERGGAVLFKATGMTLLVVLAPIWLPIWLLGYLNTPARRPAQSPVAGSITR